METLRSQVCPLEVVSISIGVSRHVWNQWREICQPLPSSSRRTRNQGRLCQRVIILGPLPTSLPLSKAHDSSTVPLRLAQGGPAEEKPGGAGEPSQSQDPMYQLPLREGVRVVQVLFQGQAG